MILQAIPHELYAAVAGGIGLFIAFIGFQHAGLVVADEATLVGMGNVRSPPPRWRCFGLILMVALEARKVRGAILIGVLTTTGARLGLWIGSLDAGRRWLHSPGRDRFQARYQRRAEQEPAGDCLCLLLCGAL